MTPYYSDDFVTLYHGDARDQPLEGEVMLTDPPYGIDYRTGRPRLAGNAREIEGDKSTAVRDEVLAAWDGPALVFGTWKTPAPSTTNAALIWDQDGALGMGDLSIPWKPSFSLIYVIGREWQGSRDEGSVLRFPPVQSVGRFHPHQKPLPLLTHLLVKCRPGVVVDPFAGSGSTLVAAKQLGRRSIGFEVDERHCETAARRCSQDVLFGPLGAAS